MNTPVVDFHAHGGGWKARAFDDDPNLYLSIMDAAGIDVACINCIFHGEARRGNDLVIERFVGPHPDRFIGVAFVTPHYPEEVVGELERCFDQLGMKFLKLYPDYFGRPSDDPAYESVYEWANDRGITIMCHGTYSFDPPGTTALRRYTAFTQKYPNIKWVIAHGAGGTSPDTVEAAKMRNVYLETCGSGTSFGGVKYAIDAGLADKVLFGTDMPIMDARQQIAKVTTIDVSDEDKQKVLGLNAIKLLGLEL